VIVGRGCRTPAGRRRCWELPAPSSTRSRRTRCEALTGRLALDSENPGCSLYLGHRVSPRLLDSRWLGTEAWLSALACSLVVGLWGWGACLLCAWVEYSRAPRVEP